MRKRLKTLAWLLGLFVAALAATFLVVNWSNQRALCQEEALARKAGLVIGYDEWVSSLPKVPESENAGRFYEQAITINWGDLCSILGNLDPLAIPQDQLATIRKKLDENGGALKLGEQAAKLPLCRVKADTEFMVPGITKTHGVMRDLATLFLIRATINASEHPREAANDIRRSRQVFRHLHQSPRFHAAFLTHWPEALVREKAAAICAAFPTQKLYQAELRRIVEAPGPDLEVLNRGELVKLLLLLDRESLDPSRAFYGLKVADKIPWEAYRDSAFQPKTLGKALIIRGFRLEQQALTLHGSAQAKMRDEGMSWIVKGLASYPELHSESRNLEADRWRWVRDQAIRRETHRVAFLALLRALESGKPAKSIKTDDLLDPDTGRPVNYSIDNRRILIEAGWERFEFPYRVSPK